MSGNNMNTAMGIHSSSQQCCRKCRPICDLQWQKNCHLKIFYVSGSLFFQLTSLTTISERLISLLCIAEPDNIVVTNVVYLLGLLRYLLE